MIDAQKSKAGWIAELGLEYGVSHGTTRLLRKAFNGPLTVQKPFYPERNVCHTYLIHPPGGIVGGDDINLQVHMSQSAEVLITTPAANKFYRSAGQKAFLSQRFHVNEDCALEMLPQESIVFDGSLSEVNNQFNLRASSKLICWDVLCLGRPASQAPFMSGNSMQRLQINVDGQAVLNERLSIEAQHASCHAAWGLRGFNCVGYMIVYPASAQLARQLEPYNRVKDDHRLGVTLLRQMLVIRYLGYHAEQAKQIFQQIWEETRPAVLQRPACPPRIWNT